MLYFQILNKGKPVFYIQIMKTKVQLICSAATGQSYYPRTPQNTGGHPKTHQDTPGLFFNVKIHMKNALQTIKMLNMNRFWVLLLNESDYRYITYKLVPVCHTIIIDFSSTPGLILCYPRTHFYTIGHMKMFHKL